MKRASPSYFLLPIYRSDRIHRPMIPRCFYTPLSPLPPSPTSFPGDRATTGETAFFPSHHPLHLALPDSRLALVLNAYRMLYSPTNTVLVYLWGCEIRRKIDLTYLGQFQGNSALSKRAQVEVEPGTKATEWRRRCGNNQSRLKDPIPAGFEESRRSL